MRRYRPRWLLLGVGAIAVVLLFTYPIWRSVFLRGQTVKPFALATDAEREALGKLPDPKSPDRNIAATAYTAMLTIVPIPTGTTVALGDATRQGSFVDLDAVRKGTGTVKIYPQTDNSWLLGLGDDFHVTNAPGLKVYLSGNSQPKTKLDLDSPAASAFPVGSLKGSLGSQLFPIPAQLAITKYHSVVIYSDALQMVYSYATLF